VTMLDDPTTLLVLAGALAVAAPLVLLGTRIRRSPFHPAIAFGLPYFFITAGPLLRYLLYGVEPYGIHLEMMGRAMLVAAAAQAGIFLGCAAARATVFRPARYLVLRRPRRLRRAACRLCLAALGVAAVSLAARWRELGTVGKLDLGAGDALWTRIHYACFFLLLAFIPAVIVADQTLERRPLPRRSVLVLGAFAALCLLQGERDVVLVLLMVPISWLAVRGDAPPRSGARGRRRSALVQVGAAFGVAALLLALLQWARNGQGLTLAEQAHAVATTAKEESVVQAILGLGSNLFIASRVVEWVPEEAPYEGGMTYVHTLVNLLPSFVLPQIRQESLLDWFKQRYAPTSQSGYGFGMEAEAYLNFGFAGPLAVFALWGFLLCRLHAGYRVLPGALLYRYTYTFFVPFSLYCIRGDSLMCTKGLLYSVTAVWIVARLCRATAHARVRMLAPRLTPA